MFGSVSIWDLPQHVHTSMFMFLSLEMEAFQVSSWLHSKYTGIILRHKCCNYGNHSKHWDIKENIVFLTMKHTKQPDCKVAWNKVRTVSPMVEVLYLHCNQLTGHVMSVRVGSCSLATLPEAVYQYLEPILLPVTDNLLNLNQLKRGKKNTHKRMCQTWAEDRSWSSLHMKWSRY